MRTEVFDASDIDEATERIIEELKKDNAGNVIYFDGWDGLGASAVLRRVAELLTPAATAEEPVFHIDCSKWESMREMQRMIAKQLKLPASMMELFDAQDEDDDFNGLAKHSRTEIRHIAEAIRLHIQQYRWFLLIFHNGSSEEINLNRLGFPQFDVYSKSKVLWSFQGRFRAYPRTKVDRALMSTSMTDVFISANPSDTEEDFADILHHEAEEVAQEMMNVEGINCPLAATHCFSYMVKLGCMSSDLATDSDLATRVCNYWRCDDIVQLQQEGVCTDDDDVDKLWLFYDAMQCAMRLDMDKFQNPNFPSPVERCLLNLMPYWISTTFGFMPILDPHGQIPSFMFQQLDKLCVLKLSACVFSFTSPPFLCCHNLRFLWLDHCRDGSSNAEAVKEEDIGRFLQRLWVLDVRYSNEAFLSSEMMSFMIQLRELNVMGEYERWDTDMLQGRMNNIRKLRIKDSHDLKGKNIYSGRHKLELLEFSGNSLYAHKLSVESSCSSLETVIISGPTNLINISLTGCAKLKNIFLSGRFLFLSTIEITGAAVKILDLSAMTAPELSQLFLLGCGNLCSILWPLEVEDEWKRYLLLGTLRIDTNTQKEGTTTAAAGREVYWHIAVRDARILRSLEPVRDYFGSKDARVEISSGIHLCGEVTGSRDNGIMSSGEQLMKDNATIYTDVAPILKAYGGVRSHAPSPATIATRPSPPDVSPRDCHIHIQDPVSRTKTQTASITLPGFICDAAKILHVHNSLHITSILVAPSAAWNRLEWCQIEGCPNLECVFNPQLVGGPGSRTGMFGKLRTAWASHLPNTRYIWKSSGPPPQVVNTAVVNTALFTGMTLLHLDCCPRLISIIDIPLVYYVLNNLETLEIMWCGDLSVAFDMSPSFPDWTFPTLKHIVLHELPKLRNIYDTEYVIFAPKLQCIKIRGCWSFRKLPVVGKKKVVECDCEKEWWDRLKWESAEHATQYKPTHPQHYKKTMIRGSVLR